MVPITTRNRKIAGKRMLVSTRQILDKLFFYIDHGKKHGSVETADFLIVRPRQEKHVALITLKALVSGGAIP